MKRIGIAVLMICLCLPFVAGAQGLEAKEPISGTRCYPEGASEDQAQYLFRYAYPQFTAVTEADEAINQYYQNVAQDIAQFQLPFEEGGLARQEGMPPAFTEIDYQVTHNDDRYVSIMLTSRQFEGNRESESISSATFARDGVYAGQMISLSQVLGLEQPLSEAGEEKGVAEELVYRLVWEIVQTQMMNVDGDFLDGIDEAALEETFSPETDFYMDEDGNLVFYVQAGMLTGEVAGVLTFPFAPAELLSAVKEP